jgi:hypothetical protein
MAEDTRWHSGRYTPKEPAGELVVGHQGRRSESWDQPPAEDSAPRLHEWRNDQWNATLEYFVPEDQSLWRVTKRARRVPTPSPPWSPWGNRSLKLWKRRSPWRQSGNWVSAVDRTVCRGKYWDCWRGSEVLLLDNCLRTQFNQPWGVPACHQWSIN